VTATKRNTRDDEGGEEKHDFMMLFMEEKGMRTEEMSDDQFYDIL
jgi:hypothetical protein